jgi:hypothetical protein
MATRGDFIMPALTGTIVANYEKFSISQSDAGRELVISASKTNMADSDLLAVIRQLTLAGGDGTGTDTGGPDAGTIAAFGTANGTAFESGVTDAVYFRVQTTGTLNTAEVSGVTLAVVAVFAPAK